MLLNFYQAQIILQIYALNYSISQILKYVFLECRHTSFYFWIYVTTGPVFFNLLFKVTPVLATCWFIGWLSLNDTFNDISAI